MMKQAKFLYPIIIVLTMLFLSSRYVYDDLRHDEVRSLNSFALQDFHTTVTFYPEPNNHIFFNLVNNAFSRVIAVRDIHEALDYISYFRLLQFLIAFGTLYFLHRFAKRFFDTNTAWISTIILITTIPFLNYMMQLRGYNLSAFFVITTLYYTFIYLEEQKKRQLLLSAFFSFLLLYTIPSNLYYYLSLMMIVGISWMYNFRKNSDLALDERVLGKEVNRSRSLILLSAAALMPLVIACYIPAFDTLLYSNTATKQPDNRFFTLVERLPQVLNYMMSNRAMLLGLGGAGIIMGMSRQSDRKLLWKWGQLWILLTMPFVFSFLRNDYPLQRTFVILTPIFSMILAIPLNAFLQSLHLKNKHQHIAMLSLYAFCISICLTQLAHIQVKLDENLKNAKRERGLYYNFYQSDSYKYLDAAKFISEQYQNEKLPVLVVPRTLDATAFTHYLDKYDIENYSLNGKPHYNSKTNDLEVKILVSAPYPYKKNTYRNIIKHRVKRQYIPGEINQTIALVDFIKNKKHIKDFYAAHSFHKAFNREIKPYFAKDFEIKKLSEGEGSLNVYRFKRKNNHAKNTVAVHQKK